LTGLHCGKCFSFTWYVENIYYDIEVRVFYIEAVMLHLNDTRCGFC